MTPFSIKRKRALNALDMSSVTNMLQSLGWRSLSDHRKDAKLCMLYKIANGLVGIPANKYLIPLTLQVTRAKNRPKCTCLCCNNFNFHHTKLTWENLVSLDS